MRKGNLLHVAVAFRDAVIETHLSSLLEMALYDWADAGNQRLDIGVVCVHVAPVDFGEKFRMVDGHPMSRLDELLPWNWQSTLVKH